MNFSSGWRLSLGLGCGVLLACPPSSTSPSAPPRQAQDAGEIRAQAPAVTARKAPRVITVTANVPEAREEFLKARKLAEDNRESEALAGFRRAVKLEPDFALALAYLGFHSSGGEGVAELDRAVQLAAALPEAEQLYIQLLWAYRHGEAEKASLTIKRLLQVAPEEWRASFELGQQAYEARNFSLAIAAYRRSVELSEMSHTCVGYNNLGYAQAMGGNFELALLALKRCTDRQPDEPNPHDSIGEVAVAAGQFERALESFQRALSNDPRFFVALQGVAAVRFFQGDHPGATEAIEQARQVAILPSDRAAVDVQAAWMHLAAHPTPKQALAQLDRMEKEARSLESSGLYDLADAAVNRSAILLEAGSPQEALSQAQLAVRRATEPGLPGAMRQVLMRRALMRKLLALAALRKTAEAQAVLGQLEEDGKAAPDHAEVISGLAFARGMVARAQGDLAAAQRELSQCKLFGLTEWTHDYLLKPEDALCLRYLAEVQEERGNTLGAAQTRARLKKTYMRDPIALYVWSRASRAQAVETPAPASTQR